jgi:farnesyl-diphosphate farnesyltransferase
MQSNQQAYLTTAMGRVSRSFALVVPWLEEPLQTYVATAYLLCRTLDNVEDCGAPLAWQRLRFAEFTHLLDDPHLAGETLHAWAAYSWPGLSADERTLMTPAGGLPLWQIYAAFPTGIRQATARWIKLMAQGMEAMLDVAGVAPVVLHDGIRVLATVADYNRYCYHVAGTVGGLATELVIDHYGLPGGLADRLLLGSEACGRALQKTNIVKDFVEDLDRRICYLPDEWLRQVHHTPLELAGAPAGWSYTVLADVLAELRQATAYVLDVPQRAGGYRIACLLCLLPAYQTILRAAERQAHLFTAEHQIKIGRETMAACLQEAVTLAPDGHGLLAHSQTLEEAIEAAFRSELALAYPAVALKSGVCYGLPAAQRR